nr:LytTR family DNA-binding domain-containing protein [uncultured Holophaga sp.]
MTQTLRVAVAEDEPKNQRRLVRLIQDCGCEVVATFRNGLEVEEWLLAGPRIDALFLDIQMPGLDGMSLRASISPEMPVVFVTAFADRAVDAFNHGAVDFLLKPVTTERLAKAIGRIRQQVGRSPSGEPSHTGGGGTRYPIIAGKGLVLMDLARTAFFEVKDGVVWAFAGERLRTKWSSLAEVEAHFPEAGLLRIHRHLLIRPQAVIGIRSSAKGCRALLRMAGGEELEASRGATPKLKTILRLR